VSHPPDIVLFLGHLHPLLVHLPIGLVLLVGVIELLARTTRFKTANSNAGLILAMAVPAAAFAAVCGWLLSQAGGYQDKLLQWHKWFGIATAATCALAAMFYRLDLKKLYRWTLFPTVCLLVVAGHFGGSLTHGSDYFVRYAPASLRSLFAGRSKTATPATNRVDVAALPAFQSVVQPVLQQNCVSCHGPEKAKGGLRLDTAQALLKGGKSGPAVVVGKSAESELIKRIRLPLTDDDHMPPNGKPQPGSDDLAVLQWWVDAGAPADKKIAELKAPGRIALILAAKLGTPAPAEKVVAPKPLNDVLALSANLSADQSIAITPLSPKDPWLQCNASVAGTNFGDRDLSKLSAIGPNLRWLDLGGTAVTDTGLVQLASMPNLSRLHLERTHITDSGLANLASLHQLEYLNLYGTEVTDAGLDQLQAISKLKQLYLWQTKVTPAAGKAFAEAHTDQDQLQHWQEEIEQLNAKIRDAHIAVDLGTILPATSSTNTAAVNTKCPVSGKPIDPTKTVIHNGVVIAFCCDDCKATFQQDPKPYLAKLEDPKPTDSATK
jgi:uncharacterized membrane protein/mono/diheme cytochrome c family protein/YHS domain-containing protein